MDGKIKSKWIEASAIKDVHLHQSAIDRVLEDKLVCGVCLCRGITVPSGSSSVIITQHIQSSAQNTTPREVINGKGIYVGTLPLGKTDSKRSRIYLANSDNPVKDSHNDDIYGRVVFENNEFVLKFYDSYNVEFVFASETQIDAAIVEIYSERDKPADFLLRGTHGGIDLSAHLRIDALEAAGQSIIYADYVIEQDVNIQSNTLQVGKRYLLTAQNNAAENGVWLKTSNGMQRDSKLNILEHFKVGLQVVILQGSRAGSLWILKNAISSMNDAKYFITSDEEKPDSLQVRLHPTNFKRLIVTPSSYILNTQEVLINEINYKVLKFNGAIIDFSTQKIYDFNENDISNFAIPQLQNGEYIWCAISLSPAQNLPDNTVEGAIVLSFGTPASTIESATRAVFFYGKPLAQVLLRYVNGSIQNLSTQDIQRITAQGSGGGGGSGSAQAYRETPNGVINGQNVQFLLSFVPISKAHTLVFVDGLALKISEYSIENNVLTLATAPKYGQELEVWYIPEPQFLSGTTLLKNRTRREKPVGSVNGSNRIFTLSHVPVNKDSLIVFLDGLCLDTAEYEVVGNSLVLNTAPKYGQGVEVFYLYETEITIGQGGTQQQGSVDFSNINSSLIPSENGVFNLGTTQRAWASLYLKDEITSTIWRLSVSDGVFTVSAEE